LKLFCFPPEPTEVGWVQRHRYARKRAMQFSENDQAKLDLFSRLACST
jgi:hypothetical protein